MLYQSILCDAVCMIFKAPSVLESTYNYSLSSKNDDDNNNYCTVTNNDNFRSYINRGTC